MIRCDITHRNTIADAVRPIVAEVSSTVHPRDYASVYRSYRDRAIRTINDPDVTASGHQRKRWSSAVLACDGMVDLLALLCNIDLGASNNRLDRATSKNSAEFGHW